MKKGFLLGLLFAFVFWVQNAFADIDPTLLMGDYVAVGAINMQTMPERKLFTDLMAFFVTDKDVGQILKELSEAGLDKKSFKRIVVGIPDRVENAEFLAIWEVVDPIDKYTEVIKRYMGRDSLKANSHLEKDYYCLKSGICFTTVNGMLVMANESRLKSFMDVTYSCEVKTAPKEYARMYRLVDRAKDAWLVFALTDSQRSRVGQADPVVDLTSENKGKMNLGSIRAGNLSIDFSKGLDASILVESVSDVEAQLFVEVFNELLRQAGEDEGVKQFGLVPFINSIWVSGSRERVSIRVESSQEVFDHLMLVVSELLKTVAHSGTVQKK